MWLNERIVRVWGLSVSSEAGTFDWLSFSMPKSDWDSNKVCNLNVQACSGTSRFSSSERMGSEGGELGWEFQMAVGLIVLSCTSTFKSLQVGI